MTFRVGLTGGIGSGKSTVTTLFEELGVPVIDTDAISRQLTQPGGAAIPAIQAEFGQSFIDASGALDREKMRQLVFSDPASKQRLEQILHPLILEQVHTLADSSKAPYTLIAVPLLFETGDYKNWLHRTVTVDCSEHTQLERTLKRNGMSEQAVHSILSQQFTRAQRLQLADDCIKNDGNLADLRPQIERLNQLYLELATISN
jgi:dephospho-CoA kinase